MTDTTSADQISDLLGESESSLYERLGISFVDRAIACLNEALALHGGNPAVVDGAAHDMSELIAPEKLHEVLIDARRLAEECNITIAQTVDITKVRTDDDALCFVLGHTGE